MDYKQRPWVEKFENGEYLREFAGCDPIYISGPYSENWGIGEEKYAHCIDFFCGIGDVTWWIKVELDKLSPAQLMELENIVTYKKHIQDNIPRDVVSVLARAMNCETYHLYRLGYNKVVELIRRRRDDIKTLLEGSRGCASEATTKLKNELFTLEADIKKLPTYDVWCESRKL